MTWVKVYIHDPDLIAFILKILGNKEMWENIKISTQSPFQKKNIGIVVKNYQNQISNKFSDAD